AVPDGENAVIFALAQKLRLLRSPAGGCGQFLVEPRLEDDIGFLKLPLRLPQLLIETAKRRAAIARHETGRIEAGSPVALALHQEHAHDGLRAGNEDALLRQIVFVVQRHIVKGHSVISSRPPATHGPDQRYLPSSFS